MASTFPIRDWSLIQAFLAVAETGSLSAAARALGVSQPTVGRQIQTIEDELGDTLFQRHRTGMALTALGDALLAPAQIMRDAAGQIAITAAGTTEEMQGTVRVSASVFTAHYVMPRILARTRQEVPGVELELVASDTTENLLFREADIAVRMYRPEQLDVITQHLGDVELALFGARSYLDRVGRPETEGALMALDFIGYDRDERILRGFRQSGMDVDKSFFKTRCDHQTVYWQLVKAGCGVGFAQRRTGLADPDVEELDLGFPLPTLPVWLTAHEAMRRTPRIRRVWDILKEELLAELS